MRIVPHSARRCFSANCPEPFSLAGKRAVTDEKVQLSNLRDAMCVLEEHAAADKFMMLSAVGKL